jgi:hypothetical protein
MDPQQVEPEDTMLRTRITIMSAVLLVALAGLAHAGAPGVNKRQMQQRARIHHGVVSGELTRGERVRLNAGQRHIHRAEWRMKSDGAFTVRERTRLHQMQNHESRAIWRMKHNARTR